ncbi:MAG: aldo/keto reductase, partial [Clostridia bacterium]
MQASQIKKLGFGLMRLPMCGEEVDIEQTKQMVDLFMEKGFTYFDTAYGYLGGKSEEAAKAALVDRYPRESFLLATKL